MKKSFQLFLTAIIFSVVSTHAFSKNNYIIYIDAGSSSSKLHIFEYEKSSSIPMIKDVFSESTKPGLSEYADHPESAGNSLKKLLDDATQFLSKTKQSLLSSFPSLFA